MATIDALDGSYAWPVDQVGPQTLTVHLAANTDIRGRTYQCEVWSKRVEDGGLKLMTVAVDNTTAGATGYLYCTITTAQALLLEPGYWFELIELTPTRRPLIRGQLATRRRVIV